MMGRRLVIQHGERVTRHEIRDKAMLVGRDPGCDLFFTDQKLSRRHARVEPGAQGVVLVDLNSRNGSWVNEEKIGERLLASGDVIRIGRLHITFEEDPLPAPTSPGSGDATVVFSNASTGERAPESALDTGTVVYHQESVEAEVDTTPDARGISRTLIRPQESPSLQELHPEDIPPDGGEGPEPAYQRSRDEELVRMLSSRSLSARLFLVAAGLAFAAYITGLVGMRYAAQEAGVLVLFGLVLVAAAAVTVFLFKKMVLNHVRKVDGKAASRWVRAELDSLETEDPG